MKPKDDLLPIGKISDTVSDEEMRDIHRVENHFNERFMAVINQELNTHNNLYESNISVYFLLLDYSVINLVMTHVIFTYRDHRQYTDRCYRNIVFIVTFT